MIKCFSNFPPACHEYKKTFVYQYGVTGNGKGLVDAMSEFAIKTPLRKAIVTKDVFYDLAQRVYEFISEKVKDDESKIYECLKITQRPLMSRF